MPNIFIIHGAYGTPNENWFPWLKEKLEKQGHDVYVPAFPTPENQTLENWLKVFEAYKDKLDEDTIMIGHSLAPVFILKILEDSKVKIKACFFVAGFTGLLGQDIDEINKTFVDREFDWEKIRKSCEKFFVYNSDNDPYVSLEKGEDLARNLGVELILVRGAGHFNIDAGYNKFKLLLDDLNNVVIEK